MKTLALRIRERRLAAGLTQKDLAARLGIAPPNISNYENGKTRPELHRLPQLADALGCSVQDLIGPDDRLESARDLLAAKLQELSPSDLDLIATLVARLCQPQ